MSCCYCCFPFCSYHYLPSCPGMWGGGAQTVDNGTAAWGQVSDAANKWGDPDDSGKGSSWGTPSPSSNKPGMKGEKNMSFIELFYFW